MEATQRRANLLVAASRWAGSTGRLAVLSAQAALLPAPCQPRVLNALIDRIRTVGDAATPALGAIVPRIMALPSALRGAAVPDGARGARARIPPPPAAGGSWAAAADNDEEARLLGQQADALVKDVERGTPGAHAAFADWLARVDAVTPRSARVPAFKAAAAAMRFVADKDAWTVFGQAIAPLSGRERADILAAPFMAPGARICFDAVLGLVADLPAGYRDRLLAELVWQISHIDAQEQVECLGALIDVAGHEPAMVCADTLVELLTNTDMLFPAGESLVLEHADRMLRRLRLAEQADLIATVARRELVGCRQWALSRLPMLAQGQAAHQLTDDAGVGAVIPYRAEIVRCVIAVMAGRNIGPSPLEVGRLWPELCKAFEALEQGAREFALAALRQLLPHLSEAQRDQASALLGAVDPRGAR